MAQFDKPSEVSDLDMAFPASVVKLMPAYDQIPEEFKRARNAWAQWQEDWFFGGLKKFPAPRDGIDRSAALRHLSCIQRSFEPKHEHKAAAVAYLASKWFSATEEAESAQ